MADRKISPQRMVASMVDAQQREQRRVDAKKRFIEAVAKYLTTNVAHKSILLQMGKPEGTEWAKIANTIPGGNGYDDEAKRIEQLTELLK